MKLTGFLLTTTLLLGPSLAMAAGEGEAVYKKSCAMCHGADGSKTAMKNKALTSADVQGMSDAALTTVITDGKGRMPAYGKKLTAAQIKDVVAYVHTLKK